MPLVACKKRFVDIHIHVWVSGLWVHAQECDSKEQGPATSWNKPVRETRSPCICRSTCVSNVQAADHDNMPGTMWISRRWCRRNSNMFRAYTQWWNTFYLLTNFSRESDLQRSLLWRSLSRETFCKKLKSVPPLCVTSSECRALFRVENLPLYMFRAYCRLHFTGM